MGGHSKTTSGGGLSELSHELRMSRTEKDIETPPPILTERERESTYRLLRVASWQVVFYLVCTDMLGWYTSERTFAMLGFAPGALVYTVFFILAFAGGQMLWLIYMNVDSEEFPVRSYADLGERTYGPVAKYVLNSLQSVQLMVSSLNVVITDSSSTSACSSSCRAKRSPS